MLNKRKKSKYWFVENMEGGYQALNKLINNEAKAIRFSTLDKMCKILDCEVGDLIVYNKRRRRKKTNEEDYCSFAGISPRIFICGMLIHNRG